MNNLFSFLVIIIALFVPFKINANHSYLTIEIKLTVFTDTSVNNSKNVIKISNISNKTSKVDYINSGDSIIFKTNDNQPVFLYRFNKKFSPAHPPMLVKGFDQNPNMDVDTIVLLNHNQVISLHKQGLYFAQTDTTSKEGLGFRVVCKDFPKFKKIPHLTQTMVYISTNNEIQSVLEAKKKKYVFNSFWLNLGGDINNSQRLIKKYFDRVSYANKHFTTFKEGWKTDKGMIYIVYGKPNNIIQNLNSERWIYIGKRNQIQFDFNSKKNIFSDKHSQLNRHTNLQRSWYKQVEKWRIGKID